MPQVAERDGFWCTWKNDLKPVRSGRISITSNRYKVRLVNENEVRE